MKSHPTRWLAVSVLISILLLLLFAPGAQAQNQSPINLIIRPAFDGYCKESRWFPVRITVENTGAEVTAQVQASYENRWNGRTAYGMELSLPAGARKEFFLYVFAEGWTGKLTVSVTEKHKTLIERNVNLTCDDVDTLLVGLLAETPSDYELLSDIAFFNGRSRVIPLQVTDLPDAPHGWQALDALVVSGADTGELTTEQRTALGVWLAQGGKLLVTGGDAWQRNTAGLTEYLPLTPTFTRRAKSLAPLATYFHLAWASDSSTTLASGTLHPTGQTLIETEGLPLLTRRPIGLGEVYYLAADPGVQPLREWQGMETVYTHLLGARVARPRWLEWPWNDDKAVSAVATVPEIGLPNFLLVCGWLGVYLLVIGPVNFLILRQIKRPEWAWLTIPALVLGFSAFAYVSGFLYRGTRPTLNRLAVIQGWDTLPIAQVKAIAGVYSPNRTRYDLKSTQGFRFLPQGNNVFKIQDEKNWLVFEQNTGQILPQAQVEIGGMKAVAAEGTLPAFQIAHDLTVTISDRLPLLSGTVTNQSKITLQDAFLVTPGSVTHVGDLSPGQLVPIRLPLQVSRNNSGFYSPNFLPDPYNSTYFLGDEQKLRRDALLRAAVVVQDYQLYPSNWGIYLMGWVETPLLPIELSDVNAKTIDTAFYIHQLTPQFQMEGDTLLINPALFVWESSTPDVSPYSSGYGRLNQGYELRFRPAFPLQFSQVTSLTIRLDGSTAPLNTTLYVWNYKTRQWSSMRVSTWDDIDLAEPAQFVGSGGEVRIRLQDDTSSWGEIYESSIDLVVQP